MNFNEAQMTYDAIVLGVGGVGSAALYHLARRGAHVLGMDRFSPPHYFGSTHGHTRVIRQAYFEHPDYVPLAIDSYRQWQELERQAHRQLLHKVGLVQIGPADGIVVPGVLLAAEQHHLPVERLSADEVRNRWPGLCVTDDLQAVYEPAGGYLLVEDCVQTYMDAARHAGAQLITNTQVLAWSAENATVRLHTSEGVLTAKRLVIAAGAWAGRLLSDLNIPLTVLRKSLFWFATDAAVYDVSAGFPLFLFELPVAPPDSLLPESAGHLKQSEHAGGVFYGFPKLDSRGVKFAEHSGGTVVNDPLLVNRLMDVEEKRRLLEVLSHFLPGVSTRVTDHSVCLYTMSPDGHFILGPHPRHANVVFAAGLSGHGFKFSPPLGQALADLALDGGTSLPIQFLSPSRFT